MPRTRTVVLTFILALVVILAMGCTPASDDIVEISETTIRISGSGTCLPLLRLLTTAYPDETVDFVYLPGLHSGGGIDGVSQGDLDLGAISRGLEPDEEGLGLDVTILSTDALAVVVHPSVDVHELTSEQVRDIYAGDVSDWAELGGSSLPLIALDRPDDESAKKILRQHVLGDDFVVTPMSVEMSYESDMVEGVESSPGSIGFFSLGIGTADGANVTYVTLDGVEPAVGTVADGSYTMTRQLGVVSNPDAPSEVAEFLEWASSAEALALMAENGFAAPREQ